MPPDNAGSGQTANTMSTASATFASDCCGTSSDRSTDSTIWWRIAIGAFLAFNSMTVALAVNLSEVDREQRFVLQGIPLCVCLIVGILLGGPMMSGVWREWRARRLTIESLFLLSSVGAFLPPWSHSSPGKVPCSLRS